jgi:hypothetical protein
MELQEYVNKVLKERKKVYLENAKNASTDILKAGWLNAYDDVCTTIYELEGLIKSDFANNISVSPYQSFEAEPE